MSNKPAPLRILILLNRIPYPLNDGGAIGAYNFVKGYAEAGCNVTMLAMNTAKHFVDEGTIKQVFSKYATGNTVYIDNRIKAFGAFKNLFKSESYIIERFVSKGYEAVLTNMLQQNEYDVVHIDGLPPAAYIDVVRKHSKAKISMRAHNVEHVIWERIADMEGNPLKKIYVGIQAKRLKEFEIAAIKKCDLVMAISKEDEDTIKAAVPNAVTRIVPAGMDISQKVENTNYNPLDLCFIGSFDWMPNLQGIDWFMKEVWADLVRQYPTIKFSIAGKQMPAHIHALKSANLNPVGEVPDAKQFILQHGLMVVPIVSGSGIRIKILEGMALGKTIIATPIAAEGLGLTHGENILIAETGAEFAACIDKCRNDESYCKQIGKNAHRFALDNYLNQNIFAGLIQYYRNMK